MQFILLHLRIGSLDIFQGENFVKLILLSVVKFVSAGGQRKTRVLLTVDYDLVKTKFWNERLGSTFYLLSPTEYIRHRVTLAGRTLTVPFGRLDFTVFEENRLLSKPDLLFFSWSGLAEITKAFFVFSLKFLLVMV